MKLQDGYFLRSGDGLKPSVIKQFAVDVQRILNSLENDNFVSDAAITNTKMSASIFSRETVSSRVHKNQTPVLNSAGGFSLIRDDESSLTRIVKTSETHYTEDIEPNYSTGILSFVVNDIAGAYVDSGGWHT